MANWMLKMMLMVFARQMIHNISILQSNDIYRETRVDNLKLETAHNNIETQGQHDDKKQHQQCYQCYQCLWEVLQWLLTISTPDTGHTGYIVISPQAHHIREHKSDQIFLLNGRNFTVTSLGTTQHFLEAQLLNLKRRASRTTFNFNE